MADQTGMPAWVSPGTRTPLDQVHGNRTFWGLWG